MRVAILGPFGVQNDAGDTLSVTGARLRDLVIRLALAGGKPVSTSALAEAVWGDDPPADLPNALQTLVSRARRSLGGAETVEQSAAGYRLAVVPDDVDALRFQRLVADGAIEEALALWRGPALADVTEDLGRIEQPRLEELRLAAIEDRLDADLALGGDKELVPELTGLVAEYPLRDRLRGHLMMALHRCGRQAEALATYREGRQILIDEAGLEPSPHLRRLHEMILSDDAVQVPKPSGPLALAGTENCAGIVAAPAVSGPRVSSVTPRASQAHDERDDEVRPEQLPPLGLDLVGRDKEIGVALNWLEADASTAKAGCAATCAITGMPGVGKTALAVRVAYQVKDCYPDGHLYVDLHGDAEPARPLDVLLRFLKAVTADSMPLPDSLEDLLSLYRSLMASRRMLIVLDNASSAKQIRPLLPASAGCGVLVTCRSRLCSLEGACILDLAVLEPSQSVELLARIAGRERVLVEPDAAERIADLCGGLPLAVRIAGAKLLARPHWPLARLAGRLTDGRLRLAELCHDDLDVRASLATTLDKLSAPASLALNLLAELDVPRFPNWVVATLLDVPALTAENLAEELIDARVLEIAPPDGQADAYRFHPLVRAAARAEGADGGSRPARQATLGHAFDAWLAVATEALRRLASEAPGRIGRARLPRQLDAATADVLLDDPLAWFESERRTLQAAAAQAHAEQHALASSLQRVYCDLARAARLRETAAQAGVAAA
jgi:DNA-binding SARP family transcriptional activator